MLQVQVRPAMILRTSLKNLCHRWEMPNVFAIELVGNLTSSVTSTWLRLGVILRSCGEKSETMLKPQN